MQKNNSFHARKNSRPTNFKGGRRPYGKSYGSSRGPKKQSIHPSKFINRVSERVETPVYESTHAFSDFALNTVLQNNIARLDYKTPSAIQDQAIPIALTGKDVIGLANTGTGKTAAFLLPIIERLNSDEKRNSVLIMAPTRELAQQIEEQFRVFASGMRLYAAICVGGTSIERQIRDLKRQPHVIIGTPGRLKDLLSRRVLRLDNINVFVLDEADRMLDMGFIGDIRHVASLLPAQRQTLCFSATITPTIQTLVQEFMVNPETVSVRTGVTSDNVDQDVIEANDKAHKLELLGDMLKKDEYEKVLVFGETKFGVQRLAKSLSDMNIPSEAIHGNKTQAQRQRALRAFKEDKVRVLVATDVAARGLDVPDVSHVINFDQPQTYDDYVHRIGRTGRAGKLGKSLTFVSSNHR